MFMHDVRNVNLKRPAPIPGNSVRAILCRRQMVPGFACQQFVWQQQQLKFFLFLSSKSDCGSFRTDLGAIGEMVRTGQYTKTHGSSNLAREISVLPSDELEVSGGPFQVFPADEQDHRSESTEDSRYNLSPSLDDIHQDRHAFLHAPMDNDIRYQVSGIETDAAGILADMPELLTFPTHGMAPSESTAQKHRQAQVQGRVSYRNSEIADIAEPQEVSALQTSPRQDPGHRLNDPGASLQHQIHQMPLQTCHLGGSPLNGCGPTIHPRFQQQAGPFVAPSFPNNVMMMMIPVSLQSMGQTRLTAVPAGPSILVPLHQPHPSAKPDTVRVPERTMAPNGSNLSEPTTVSGKVIDLFLDFDSETLSEYQCLLRKQIELFEAGPEEILASAQGRNSPILLGQVGIRCRHCARAPVLHRSRRFAYYSKSMDGLYQVAQNMSKEHFVTTCQFIPPIEQHRLAALQQGNRRAAGGKEYWRQALRVLGVYEDGPLMRFRDSALGEAISLSETKGGVVELDSNMSSPTKESNNKPLHA